MPLIFSTAILAAAALYFIYKRLLRYLRYFQQEEYSAKRFAAWIKRSEAWDRRGTATLFVAAALLSLAPESLELLRISMLLASVILIFFAKEEDDPRKSGKIKLVMTTRARRIFYLALALATLLTLFIVFGIDFIQPLEVFVLLVLLIQATPLLLAVANLLLTPAESAIKRGFLEEAKEKLARQKPFVIAITGSYGKTSTKAALGEILNAAIGPTFCPPKSINTPMGITREIRENLRPEQRHAVIEMGAYNVGSIARLCELAPPRAAIVTGVGVAHLERYGSQEQIYRAKSELPQAVPADGILVCNGDNPGARRMAQEFRKQTTLLYGLEPRLGELDARADAIATSANGTSFTIHWKGQSYPATTKLFGRPALSNLLAAFTMACALGADPQYVIAVIANLKPVDNRLAVSNEGGVTWIRDAYNSNPDGFRAALEILRDLPGARKILITPGMIELGAEQYGQNRKIAEFAAGVCTTVIVIGETNRAALVDGLRVGGLAEAEIVLCTSRKEGFDQLAAMLKPGDAVLVENDLPDLYEHKERF